MACPGEYCHRGAICIRTESTENTLAICRMKINAVLFVFLIMIQQNLLADCETDRFGVVYCGRGYCAQNKLGNVACSKYLFGDAILDKNGEVVCGKGKCLPSTKFDDFYCSAIESGGAKLDRFGVVKCYGGCEQASALMCESEPGK